MDRRLIIEHIPRLRRYARALVGDRYVADDLVQDTLERAWNKFYLWRPGSDLRAWLFTIMHNVFVNQARRRRYEIEQAMEEVPAVSVRATQSEHLELQDVDRVLRSLPTGKTRSGCARTPSKTPCSVPCTPRSWTSPYRRRYLQCARTRGCATPPRLRYSRSESDSAGSFAGCSSHRRSCRRRSHAWRQLPTRCMRPRYAIRWR